jgi:hypothetical protein
MKSEASILTTNSYPLSTLNCSRQWEPSQNKEEIVSIMADITSQEYQQYMALRDQINTGIETADSEFMLQTYSMLRGVMNKRQKAALQLNIQLENKAIREKKDAKREQLRNGSTSSSGGSQRPASSRSDL